RRCPTYLTLCSRSLASLTRGDDLREHAEPPKIKRPRQFLVDLLELALVREHDAASTSPPLVPRGVVQLLDPVEVLTGLGLGEFPALVEITAVNLVAHRLRGHRGGVGNPLELLRLRQVRAGEVPELLQSVDSVQQLPAMVQLLVISARATRSFAVAVASHCA